MSNRYIEFQSHTPALNTNLNSVGDLMENPEELTGVFPDGTVAVTIVDLVVVDRSAEAAALDVLFTTVGTAWGTLNDPVDISGSIAENLVGKISIAASDYDDYTSSAVAYKHDVRVSIPHVDSGRSIYVAMVSRGTATYAADSLTLKFGIEKG